MDEDEMLTRRRERSRWPAALVRAGPRARATLRLFGARDACARRGAPTPPAPRRPKPGSCTSLQLLRPAPSAGAAKASCWPAKRGFVFCLCSAATPTASDSDGETRNAQSQGGVRRTYASREMSRHCASRASQHAGGGSDAEGAAAESVSMRACTCIMELRLLRCCRDARLRSTAAASMRCRVCGC
jgi:hypothetical protein